MLTAEQQAQRLSYIGASESAAVLGLSHWQTPLEIWAIKTGQIVPDGEETLAQWWGSELEDAVAKRFMKETGKKVHRVRETLFHPNYPFIATNLDRRVVGEDAILECKTCSVWKSKEWEGEEIPMEYIIQCYHELAVSGKSKCYLAVAIGNQAFHRKEILRDEKIINDIINKEVSFWNDFVLTKTMPELITKNDDDVLERIYPQALVGTHVPLPDHANRLIENLQGYKADYKNLEDLITQEENKLKAMIKENEIGITSLYQVAWKNSQWSGLDAKSLKSEYPTIYEQFYKSKPTRRFSYDRIK